MTSTKEVDNKKTNKSVITSAIITLVIVLMLIFSGPVQAVTLSITGLPGYITRGSIETFTVQITIEDPDNYVPVSNFSLDITGATQKSWIFDTAGNILDGGSGITIAPISNPGASNYGYGYGYRYGYDRGYRSNFGYGYGYGFGYGYGAGGGSVTFVYSITLDTSILNTGSHTAVASLNTGDKDKPAFSSDPATFEINPINVGVDILSNINPKSNGVVPVAILSTADFNAITEVNVSTVSFGPGGAMESHGTGHDEYVNNDGLLDLVLHFNIQETGIKCGDTQATLTGKTNDGNDIEGTDTFVTPGCGGGSGGGTGGGGVSTSEPFENIKKAERHDKTLFAGKPVAYTFIAPEHGVYEIVVTGEANEYDIALRVEALKDTSKLVSASPPGAVYNNLNVWAGTKRIKEALIRFKVENSWLGSNNIASGNLKMVRWDGSQWVQLDTTQNTKDNSYTYYEAKTSGFSVFAVVGIKDGEVVPTEAEATAKPTAVTTPIGEMTPAQETLEEKESPGFGAVAFISAMVLMVAIRNKRR